MYGSWEKLLLKTHHDFRGLEQGTADVFLPVYFRGVLLLNLAFKVFFNIYLHFTFLNHFYHYYF